MLQEPRKTRREIPRLPSSLILKVPPGCRGGQRSHDAKALVLEVVVIPKGSFRPWPGALPQAEAAGTRHPQRLRARCPPYARASQHRVPSPPRHRPSRPRTPCAPARTRRQGGQETRRPPAFGPAWPTRASPPPAFPVSKAFRPPTPLKTAVHRWRP